MPNPLDAWFLEHPEVSQAQFARAAGLTAVQVTRLRKRPDLQRIWFSTAQAIARGTKGELGLSKLYPAAVEPNRRSRK